MPKKSSSSKTPAKNQETPLVGDEKPSLKPKKSSNEIDEIFAGKKRKLEGKKTHKSNEDETVEPKLMKEKTTEKKKSKIATEGDFADPPARPKKRSEDGLALYTGGVGY
ncbi:hypothetical protein LWI29_004083 [Acer saccharum]|uniref:Uncharacterized protein n=1 Tax=Acer saccharum TaxID=4024 RepID=A0AA39V8C6_ACESA|nr:hypothetical protein LWI29_004083 [Acer saccharum]